MVLPDRCGWAAVAVPAVSGAASCRRPRSVPRKMSQSARAAQVAAPDQGRAATLAEQRMSAACAALMEGRVVPVPSAILPPFLMAGRVRRSAVAILLSLADPDHSAL